MKYENLKPDGTSEAQFIAWDGEGENINGHHRLILLANSKQDLIVDKNRNGSFTWEDWLPFLARYKHSINIWYSFGYDVNMIFKDLPEDKKIRLFQEGKRTEIGEYKVKYIPRKILTITKKRQTFTHYDVFGFFQTSFLNTMRSWNIDIPEIIEQGKELRSDFTKQNLDFIVKYNDAECAKLVEICVKLKQYIEKAKIPALRSWHGAGAIASRLLDSWGFANHKTNIIPTPQLTTLFQARKYAYFGGRSELFFRGIHERPIYQYDINSAYPNACRFVPSLLDKEWIHYNKDDIHLLQKDDFALIHVKWKLPLNTRVGPLPFRLQDNTIIFPSNGEGWYHNVEVQAALEKKYQLELCEAWVLERPYDFFLRDHIEGMAAKRLELKKKKDLGNIPIKLGLNALYGKIAQKPIKYEGFVKYGKYTDLFLSGFITAHTRAKILSALNYKDVVMIATDGIFSLSPLDVACTDQLGDWEYTEHKAGNFLLSGIYALQSLEGKWKLKTRGYTNMDYNQFLEIHNKQVTQEEVRFLERRFISIKLALRSNKWQECEFQPMKRIVNWNNNKKRLFKSIEAPTSDSYTVTSPRKQPMSKMYLPLGKDSIQLTENAKDIADSYHEDEL